MDEVADRDTLAGPVSLGGTEAAGFDDLFLREFPRVARALHHIVGDRGRADEVAQDAFL